MSDTRVRTVAVTGATGLIGRHFCHAFRREGWRVRALVRDAGRASFEVPGIERFGCDLPDGIDPAGLDGAAALIHAAWMTRFTNKTDAQRVNEEGSQRLFALARRQGVGQVLFLSSFSSRPAARSYYGQSKFAVEQRLDLSGDLVLRPGLVLAADGGLFQRILAFVRRARVVPVVGGGQIVQTVHIEDLCRACVDSVERRLTGMLCVAEPDGLPFRELLRLTARLLGQGGLHVPIPAAPALAVLRLAELLGLRLGVSSENLLGIVALRPVRVEEDLKRLGFRPRSAHESIAQLLATGTRGRAERGAA